MSTEKESVGVQRRKFLKVLGATSAATTLIGCDSDGIQRLIPYVVSPDQTVPGVSSYYASVCRECAAGCGIIAETRDGKSTKLEGNPEHPVNKGALCSRGQSAVQGLYNPDRFRTPMIRQNGTLVATTWDKAMPLFAQKLGEVRSKGEAAKAVFVNQHEIGSFPGFLDQWLANYGMPAHLSYDAEADLPAITAHKQVYGAAWPMFDFDKAAVIVSFGADFLDNWGLPVPQQLAWADARGKLADAPRFIYVGARRSLTGLNADEWIPARAGGELAIAHFLAGKVTADAAATAAGVKKEQLEALAKELKGAKASLLLAGGFGPNATDLCVAVAELNKAMGNVGVTVRPAEGSAGFDRIAGAADMRELADKMKGGGVSLLMVRGANPAYTTPKSVGFAGALAKVAFKVSFSSFPDETTELADLVLPDHHALEQWGDAEAGTGMVAIQQPTMDPVFDTRATTDVLIAAAQGDPANSARYKEKDFRSWLLGRFPGGAQAFAKALAKGVTTGKPAAGGVVAGRTLGGAPRVSDGGKGDFSLIVYPSPLLGDGRGANKPWLQEMPDPVSKIAWQSWIELHPLTARKMGIERGDHVTVTTAAGSVTAPAWPFLGVREDTVAMALGQGHTAYGRYAKGIGVNALDAIGGEERSGALALGGHKASVAKAAGHSDLVSTEGSARQHGRGIARAIPVAALASLKKPSFRGDPVLEEREAGGAEAKGEHGPSKGVAPLVGPYGGEAHVAGNPDTRFGRGLRSPVAADAQGEMADSSSKDKGLYDPNHPSGMAKRRWAMTIDLAKCTGCSACVTACYAENNIPTVGAPWQGRTLNPMGGYDDRPGANILKGREMSWLRLERYFEGGEDGSSDFETRFTPMLCQHCGNAPCEPVCPVYATYHAPDGLNVQVYNRCVGTRYCSNNCPYKVRYFNWFGYGEPDRRQYAFPEPLNWQLNPDVTVRGKGVMEKCTFCVQRIREAENRSALEHRGLEGDEFTTACASACPSRAITFGDAADDAWTVAKIAAEDPRSYHVFDELNTFTAVVYLQKVNHAGAGQAAVAAAAREH